MEIRTIKGKGISPLRKDDGHMAVSEAEKAGVLNNFFAKIQIFRWEKGQII